MHDWLGRLCHSERQRTICFSFPMLNAKADFLRYAQDRLSARQKPPGFRMTPRGFFNGLLGLQLSETFRNFGRTVSVQVAYNGLF